MAAEKKGREKQKRTDSTDASNTPCLAAAVTEKPETGQDEQREKGEREKKKKGKRQKEVVKRRYFVLVHLSACDSERSE